MLQFPRIFSITLSALIIFTLSDICFAETRYALVIGNGDYSVGKLTSPPLDADAMERILTKLNYKVVARKNLTRDQFYKEISKFGELLQTAGSTGFFYYSGHGNQVKGTNYMIPVDLEIFTEYDIEEHGVRVDSVISRMNMGKSNPNIIVLDACRNNPFEKSSKNGSTGLAEMKHIPSGTLIAFAAAPGRVALQSPNRLSPYTAELLNQLAHANMSLIPLFQAAQDGVWKATHGGQEPRIEISPNLRDIVLNREQTSIRSNNSMLEATNIDQKNTIATSESEKSTKYEEAFHKASQGDTAAQYSLGWMYEHGEGVAKDLAKAVEWYQKSAERGNADAQRKLAFETSAVQSKNTESKTKYWYYCRNPDGYYPYRRKCPGNNWLKIPPLNEGDQTGGTYSSGIPVPPLGRPPTYSPFDEPPFVIPPPPPPKRVE